MMYGSGVQVLQHEKIKLGSRLYSCGTEGHSIGIYMYLLFLEVGKFWLITFGIRANVIVARCHFVYVKLAVESCCFLCLHFPFEASPHFGIQPSIIGLFPRALHVFVRDTVCSKRQAARATQIIRNLSYMDFNTDIMETPWAWTLCSLK